MNCSKLIVISFGVLSLFVIGTSEARSHVNFGFGVNVQERPRYAYAPAYVEEHYYPQERVVVQHDAYGRVISEHVYVTPVQSRTVYVQPAYRERVRPATRSFFSFSFFR